jgi:hypothetical protein
MSKPKYWSALSLRVGVKSVRLDVRFILEQAIQDVDSLPYSARDKVTEQSYVGIGNVVVAQSAIASIADVILREEILLVEIPLGPVC